MIAHTRPILRIAILEVPYKYSRQSVVAARDRWSCSLAFIVVEWSVLRHKHRHSPQDGLRSFKHVQLEDQNIFLC